MSEKYQYRAIRFYVTCFAATWAFWTAVAVIGRKNDIAMTLMLFGLMAPDTYKKNLLA